MTNEKIQLVELETQLAADESGQIRNEICVELSQYASEWKRHLDRGLSPEEFAPAQSVVEGLAAAEEVVEKFWANAHR